MNCNLNSQLMNIQLTQQTLACFTALLLNILYLHPCLHVFMNSREKHCLLKSLVKPRLKCLGGAGGHRPSVGHPFSEELQVRLGGSRKGRPREGKDWPSGNTAHPRHRRGSEFWGYSRCLCCHRVTSGGGAGTSGLFCNPGQLNP